MENLIQENISFVDVYVEEVMMMEGDQYMYSMELFLKNYRKI
jgi:hypothetical protein